MEYWDIYTKDRKKTNKVVKRGEVLKDDEYHLVVNVWIKNDNDEYLITQRANNKSFAGMWECTGGSVLKGESTYTAALREAEEELGINLQNAPFNLVGSIARQFENCPDILDVWLFNANFPLESVKIQEEEVQDVKWATKEEILKMYDNGEFEANAFFIETLNYCKEDNN